MMTASLMTEYAALPHYVQLMLTIMAGSALACLAVGTVGWLSSLEGRRRSFSLGLPPLPPGFPYRGDIIYTIIFLALVLWGAAAQVLPGRGGAEMELKLNWETLLFSVGVQVGIYLPMLVRYVTLHPWQRPTRPWWHYLTLPLLFWALIYAAVMALEASGFSSWLVRETGCPEYQDVVLLFSRGDEMQRLYVIICAVVVAPIAEECCFRGFLYRILRRHGGTVAAAVASALLFAAIHGSLAQMLPLTLFGVALCFAYEHARSLWLPIAVHMVFNTTSLIATALTMP